MTKEEWFKNIADNYFENKTLGLDAIKFIASKMPVFGEVQVIINDNDSKDGGKEITVRDNDKAMIVYAPEDVELTDEDFDMSTTLFRLTTDAQGVITIVEHGFSLFTNANKEYILILGALVGKTLDLSE